MNGKTALRAGWRACVLLLVTTVAVRAQNPGQHQSWPDPLTLETYSGTIIIDDAGLRPVYYLDTDSDGVADYHLSFGPWWYEPSSGAVRPEDGAVVTIVAAAWDCDIPDTLMVFELDGLIWREPVEYGRNGWVTVPTWEPGASMVTVSGTVQVDDTYFYDHYYLDVDADDAPDFQLGFGPHWYEPASGAVRPSDGDQVTVTGCLHEVEGPDILAVFEIDGLIWREAGQPAPWSGGWVDDQRQNGSVVRAGNEHGSEIEFPGGAMNGNGPNGPNGQNGQNGNGEQNRHRYMFVEFWNVHPDYLPGEMNQERNRERFTGYHLAAYDEQGNRMMNHQYGQNEGRMQFQRRISFRLRFNEQVRNRRHLDANLIRVQYWDESLQQWAAIPDVSVDLIDQTVSFTSDALYSYYAIVSSPIAAATRVDSGIDIPASFELGQNYPNPFNPATVIPFSVSSSQRVIVTVYNSLGVQVGTLLDGIVQPGSHSVTLDAGDWPSGVYLYRIRGAGWTATRMMALVK